MIAQGSKSFLRQQFEVLLGAYRWPEREGWFSAWETWLAEFPEWAVGQVVMSAPDRWPNEMPEVGPLRAAIAAVIQKRRREEKDEQERNAPRHRPPLAYTGNPKFLEIAKRWEKEDRENPSTESRGPQRARELSTLWAGEARTKTIDGESVELQQNPKGKRRFLL